MNIIQPFSSRFETPRVRLSNESFINTGINLFFTEKVPFADRTGSRFAKSIVNLLEKRIEKLKRKGKIHIYELGAGTGILALRILDYLKFYNQGLYRQIVLHVSDYSQPAIAELAKLPQFKPHSSRIDFEVVDAINPRFKYKPLFIYFTDLLDALPCRHIQTINGGIFEIQVQTFAENDSQIIDTKEEHRRIPIDSLKNMGKEEKSDLINLTSVVPQNRTYNYSFAAKQCLQKCLTALEPGGFILFSDFGTTSKETSNLSLWEEFGKTIFFSVDFYGIGQAFEKSGTTVMLATNKPGGPQEMLIDTLNKDKNLETKFKEYFGWNNQQQIDEFLTKTKNILQTKNLQAKNISSMIGDLYKTLPQDIQMDYQILNDLALFLQLSGYNKQAIEYTQILEKEYKHTAGIYCYLIRARAYQALGNFILAEKNFKKATQLGSTTALDEIEKMRKNVKLKK